MAQIELRGVRKGFGAFVAVAETNLVIRDEEFLVLLGPSGCGKTTTMRMIAGLEEPTEGEIVIGGEVVNGIDPRERDVAMVFQGYALYPNMTIYENIRFPLRMRKVPRRLHPELVRRAADKVELGDYLARKPAALSGGQRQRAALARAIVRQPQVFLMDEPLSNLDAKLRTQMRVELKHLQHELRTTTVYVTHDQVEAMTLADRVVIMNRGVIQQVGTPQEVYNDPANTFVAGFIGAPPMNLLAGQIEGGSVTGDGFSVHGLRTAGAGEVTLGVRPEDARLSDAPANLSGKAYGVEPMGDQTVISVATGDGLFEVKCGRDVRVPLDSTVHVAFDPARIYLFDRASGQRLRAAA